MKTTPEFEAVIEDNLTNMFFRGKRVESITSAGLFRARAFLLAHANCQPNVAGTVKRTKNLSTFREIAHNLSLAGGAMNARLSDGQPCGF